MIKLDSQANYPEICSHLLKEERLVLLRRVVECINGVNIETIDEVEKSI